MRNERWDNNMLSVLQINLLCQDIFILLHLTYIWTRISVWLRSHTQIQVMDFFPFKLAIVVATTTRILQWTLSVIEQLTFFNFFYCLLTDLYVRKYCYIVYRLFVFVLKASKITFYIPIFTSPEPRDLVALPVARPVSAMKNERRRTGCRV